MSCCLDIKELARSSANHFVILFRDANQQFRGLYTYYPDSDDIIKIYGLGPRQITDQMFDRFYKYDFQVILITNLFYVNHI